MNAVSTFQPLITISVGEYELITSGILNLFASSFDLHISDLHIRFEFKEDPNTNKVAFMGEVIDETTLKITLNNMKNGFLEGFYRPLQLGTLNNRAVFINFSAWSLQPSEGIRTLVYNIYFKKDVV